MKYCPRCREILSRFEVFGIELDQCAVCHGLWFGPRDLERVKDRLDQDVRWKDLNLREYASRTHFKHTRLTCPGCQAALCEIHFDDTRIELEFCARCGGVWTDQGRLGKILSHIRRKMDAEPTAQVARETLTQFLEIFFGHKGPWEEIKDFVAAWRLLTLKFVVDHPDLAMRLQTARRALPF
ncbi:MAG: zf-TFIIB domain-containing protein [Elusimicrobia bacterium]|nr:zf-TFIIB domain-containing protein [Elusimicrobiota bacterium]